MSLGRNLKSIINNEHRTIRWVSERSGISQATIFSIVKDDRIPRMDTVYCIIRALGYDMYLVAPNGRKQKYVTMSDWIKFIMDVHNANVTTTANMFYCTNITIYHNLRNMQCMTVDAVKIFADRFNYTIKLVKDDIEYNLFEPVDI